MHIHDRFGRKITYLRISVTDVCNMRCIYCTRGGGMAFLPPEELLTIDEITSVTSAAVSAGITKIRLTGGEPLSRPDILELVASLSRIGGIEDLTLTTNGLLLQSLASKLRESGLQRINVSLDTLDPIRFGAICNRGSLEQVLGGIDAALEAGLDPLKINVVVMSGENDSEIGRFAEYSMEKGVTVRFIEYMPVAGNDGHEGRLFTREMMIERLKPYLNGIGEAATDPREPARYFTMRDGHTMIGVISPVTHGFCSNCNRMRLTSDGFLRGCLLSEEKIDIKSILRSGAGRDEIVAAFRQRRLRRVKRATSPSRLHPCTELEDDVVAEVVSVNISPRKGLKKAPVNELNLIEDYGAEGDAHAQSGALRQISLLAEESIEKMKGLGMELHPGDFAENITTRGLDLASIPVGTLLRAGGSAVLEITQIGKKCHGDTCEIFRQIGDCVMPREGIFARVVKGGKVVAGDTISIA